MKQEKNTFAGQTARRSFMKKMSLTGLSSTAGSALPLGNALAATLIEDPWQKAQDIVDRLSKPLKFFKIFFGKLIFNCICLNKVGFQR